MSTISALGIGSGLDLNGLLDQLQSAERQKLVPIVQTKRSYEAKLSAYGQLRSALDQFQSAADKINKSSAFEAVNSAVTGDALSAAAAKGAQPGAYQVSVSQLARPYSVASSGTTDRDADLGAGEVRINLASGDSLSVTLESDKSSLANLRDAINAENAGVKASIINDGSAEPYRLALTSAEEGEDAAISSVDFGALATELTIDPLTEVAARSANFSVNGVDIVSQTNQVEGAIEGLTLSLDEVGDASIRVNIDAGAIERSIENFVSKYNNLQQQIGKLSSFNQETGEAGELLGDSTLRSVESRLRSVFVGGVENGDYQRLADVGISLQLDGTLEADSDTISELVASDLGGLKNFFAASSTEDGLAGNLNAALEGILNETGMLDIATDGLDSRIESLDDRYDRTQRRIERTIERYRSRFTALDSMVASMNSQSAYLAQQFDILNAQTS